MQSGWGCSLVNASHRHSAAPGNRMRQSAGGQLLERSRHEDVHDSGNNVGFGCDGCHGAVLA